MSSGKGVAWRRFAFFDKDIVDENIETVVGRKPTCAEADGGMLRFGDGEGVISIADRNFQIGNRKHKAFRGPIVQLAHIFDPQNPLRQFIVAVGDEIPRNLGGGEVDQITAAQYVIKVFNTGDWSRPVQVIPVSNFIPVGAAVTAFAVLPDASQIAVGTTSGTLLLYSGAFLKETLAARHSSPQVLMQSHGCPISALHFCELSSTKPNDKRVRLFAVMDTTKGPAEGLPIPEPSYSPEDGDDPQSAGICVFDTSMVSSAAGLVPAQRRAPHLLDERGAQPGCSSFMNDTKELVIGREEGVFSYSVEDRGGAAAFEGEKQCICAVGRYVLVACIDEKSKRTSVTIYDLRNKFIGMHSTLPAGEKVAMVLQDGGISYVITSNWSLVRFRERDTSAKLEVLLRKSLYPLAISLAAEEQSEVAEIMKLYKQYGDHLYKKGEYDAASTQYCNTIGYLQPSYVIRRFLDPHRLPNLIMYLEKLHERGLASKDHTTLLLTCYTKTKDESKINHFVENDPKATRTGLTPGSVNKSGPNVQAANSGSAPGGSNGTSAPATAPTPLTIKQAFDEGSFDVLTAVSILQGSGFIEHALRLALRHRLHQSYIQIQLNKRPPEADKAMSYLIALIFEPDVTADDFRALVLAHGRALLATRADAFTGLLMKLCIADYKLLRPSGGGSSGAPAAGSIATCSIPTITLNDVVSFYCKDDARLRMLADGLYEELKNKNRIVNEKTAATVLELTLQEHSEAQKRLLAAPAESFNAPTNRISGNFKVQNLTGEFSGAELKQQVAALEEKIMSVLDSPTVQYDPSHALLLCHMFDYAPGTLFLLEQSQSTEMLIRQHMESGDDRALFKTLRREGRKDPELYIQVLRHVVRKACTDDAIGGHMDSLRDTMESTVDGRNTQGSVEDDDDRWDSVCDMLSLIEKENVLPTVQVISILASNPEIPLHIVAGYVNSSLQETSDEVQQLEFEVAQRQTVLQNIVEEERAKKLIGAGLSKAALRAQTKAANRTKRESSESFDDDYENEDDDELDRDMAAVEAQEEASEQKKWEGIRKTMQDRAHDHESFFAELEQSADGFKTVAEYYGKMIL